MVWNKKARRHNGWKYPSSTLNHEMKIQDIRNRCLEPQPYWDDWDEYRDGMRNYNNHLWHEWDKNKKNWKRGIRNGQTI